MRSASHTIPILSLYHAYTPYSRIFLLTSLMPACVSQAFLLFFCISFQLVDGLNHSFGSMFEVHTYYSTRDTGVP